MDSLNYIATTLTRHQWTLSVAESCTGGTFTSYLTSLPGASIWLKEALVVYSIESKVQRLGIPLQEIVQYGVVSSFICTKMAVNTKIMLDTDFGIGITGNAGPTAYSNTLPGQVYIAFSTPKHNQCEFFHFHGSRLHIQEQASKAALTIFHDWLKQEELAKS
jgi:PncC family amidohydrolase